MKRLMVLYILCISFISASALTDSLGIKTINGVKYIEHKVEKSQGLYAISKRYGVSVEDIKKANNNVEVLALDQILLVPVPRVIVDEKKFYHVVEKGETLYKISVLYRVSVDNLEKWNYLKNESIKAGDSLIIIQQVKSVVVDQNVPNTGVKNPNSKEVTEEGIATWIEDPSIDSRKALALHKKAPIGTIILVTNPLTDKQVYVKVVGNLPKETGQSNEIIKLSKYAAKQLKIRDQLTRVKISYQLE